MVSRVGMWIGGSLWMRDLCSRGVLVSMVDESILRSLFLFSFWGLVGEVYELIRSNDGFQSIGRWMKSEIRPITSSCEKRAKTSDHGRPSESTHDFIETSLLNIPTVLQIKT
jgi:hypothetical protein